MTTIVVPSATVAMIAWLRSRPDVAAAVVTITASRPVNVVYPYMTVMRITGVSQIREMPMDFARLQLNIWGGTKDSGLPDWAPADDAARIVEAEVRAWRGGTVGDAHISEMTGFEGMQQLEDPETRDARYWMDVLAIVRRADGQ